MNSPTPVPAAKDVNVAPTLGSILGTAAGLVVANKFGLDPMSPGGGTTVASVAGLITAIFHWIGSKIGAPGLG